MNETTFYDAHNSFIRTMKYHPFPLKSVAWIFAVESYCHSYKPSMHKGALLYHESANKDELGI